MSDVACNEDRLERGGLLSRRQVVHYGGLGAAAAFLPTVLSRSKVAAQATPGTPETGINVSAEAQAYYRPGTRFDGTELNVVLNAGFLSDAQRQEAMEALRVQFEDMTGARVIYAPLPENQLYDTVRLELANESGKFDLMHTGAGGAKDFGLSGFLVPLPAPPDIDDFYPGDVSQYSVGGQLYGLPMTADTNLLYWRADLFEQAGLDPNSPPETYDQFREFAIRLTSDTNGRHPGEEGFDENNIEVFGSGFKGTAGLANTWEWYNYLYAFGGELMDDEYNPSLGSPESVASLTWLVDNFRTHKIYPADILTYDYTEYVTLFLQGRMAMAINWPYMWAQVQDPTESKVAGKVKVGRKPGQATHGGEIGGWSWNVFKMSENQEAAIAFAKWMSSPDAALIYAQTGMGNPVRISVASVMASEDPELYAAIDANLADGRSVEWLDTGPSWMEIERVQYEAIQAALIGDKTPQEAFDDADAEAKDILEQNGFYDELLPQLRG